MYPGLPQLSKRDNFVVIINDFQPSTVNANLSVLDVYKNPGDSSGRC